MKTTRTSQTGWRRILPLLFAPLVVNPASVHANPSGPNVAHGNIRFDGLGTSNLNVHQGTKNAVINWQKFDIGPGEVTTFLQPGKSSVALNRVNAGDPSAIYGSLRANGGVIVVNPNGVVVHKGGVVDVGGLMMLSTLDVKDSDFLNGGGMRFRGSTKAGIRNYGAITSDAGDVVLLGNFLRNSGDVSAPAGTVAFGAGGDIIVNQAGGATISVLAGGEEAATGIHNTGSVNAAAAEFAAHGNAYALAIRNDGLVRANGYQMKGGRLSLTAGSRGNIINTGGLYARNADGSGGRIEVSGDRVEVSAGSMDASGDAGRVGGSVAVSGNVVAIGEPAELRVGGSRGGEASITATEAVEMAGSIDASASIGRGGAVDVTAESVIIGSSASIHASGRGGGGALRIGGGISGKDASIANASSTTVEAGAVLRADSEGGDGGSVVVFGQDDTIFSGEISARALGGLGNGGFVEVSGKRNLLIDGTVSTRSANGRNGTLLIDPVDVTIYSATSTDAGTMSDAALRGFVANNHVIIHTSGESGGSGIIRVLSGAKVIYDSPNSLAFLAHDSIIIDGDIKNIGTTDNNGTGNITLAAGWDGTLPVGLPNDAGESQSITGFVEAADFINPDGTPLATPGRYGTWGGENSRILLNSGGQEAVEVGSARGETNLFAETVQLRHGFAEGRFAQVGYRRVADTRDAVYDPANGQFGAYFANPDDQIVDGNINVSGKRFVFMQPSDQFNFNDLNKVHARAYTMIGHGGIRRGDDSVDFHRGDAAGFGFGYDSGVIAVDDGDNSGDITVHAGLSLTLVASRLQAQTQIGHGGHGGGTPNNGNVRAGLGTVIRGDMSGNIRITAGGVEMEAGLLSDAPVQIGHGGLNVRGDHSGNITVTSTLARIRGIAAPNMGDVGPITNPNDFRWTNNRDRSYVMIGHGGVNSYHPDALPARNLPVGTGGNTSYAGDGIAINPDTGLPYGHSGDVTIHSAFGVHFTASGNQAFAKIGHGGDASHGDHRGDIEVVAERGDVIFDRIAQQVDSVGRDRRNTGSGAFVQIGHGGRRASGGGTGDITVSASGDVEFHAGRNEAFAMIGHGGRGIADSTTVGGVGSQRNTVAAAGTHSGTISVTAGGDIKFRGGFGSGSVTAFAMIGHGGYRQYADILENVDSPEAVPYGGGATRILADANGDPILDGNGLPQLVPDETQQGHNGDISVTAGGDIDFRAGQVEGELLPGQTLGIEPNGRVNFVMIGNGGDESFGDHWGNIDLNAGGDLIMEARGGWDGVSIFSTDTTGMPRLGQYEDNSTTGNRNFAYIGNGGYNSSHRVVANSPAHISGSGKIGEGMGVWGPSDIHILTGGDIRLMAAQEATVGPKLYQQAFRQTVGSAIVYTDYFGNLVDLLDYSEHAPRLTVIDRSDGNTWVLPDPVMTAQDSFVQIGNGARASNYQGGVDGEGHRGDITIHAGGGITVEAGDIEAVVAHGETLAIHAFPTGGDPGTDNFTIQVGPGTPDADITGLRTSGNDQRARSAFARNYAQIGLGGYQVRGDHLGNISITAGANSGNVGLRLHAGESAYDYAQIGNGGYNSTGYNDNGELNNVNSLLNDIGDTGDISVRVAGDILIQSGGVKYTTGLVGDTTDSAITLNSDSIYSYAKIGNGGDGNYATHSGDITVISTGGGLDLLAGHNRYASATIGHGGYDARAEGHHGDIVVSTRDDILIRGGKPFVDPITGHISQSLRSSAQIGHGGYASNARSGNLFLGPGVGGHFGSIQVLSSDGSITVKGGGDPTLTQNSDNFSMNLAAQIGHGGGVSTHGDHRGDIRVAAGGNVAILGGAGGRDSYTQIGHGGVQTEGHLSGTIEIVAGNSVILNRGADTDTGSFNRAGSELFNNWAKIGHGDQYYRQRNSGSGNRSGDIFVSAGNSIHLSDPTYRPFADQAYTRPNSDQTLLGHIPSENAISDPFRATAGNTFLSVGRNDPYAGGAGQLVTFAGAQITSAGEGFFGDLRIYMPDASSNRIAAGTYLNGVEYSRSPMPGSGRADEQVATESVIGIGAYGEPTAPYLPAGAYPYHGFGPYNIYYGGTAPEAPAPPEAPTTPDGVPDVVELPDFASIFLDETYDFFNRGEALLAYDGYGDPFDSIALSEATFEDGAFESGGWFLEEFLDGSFGERRDGTIVEDLSVLGLEDDEDEERRRRRSERKVGKVGLSYYVYNPDTNRYSSYRVFGVPYDTLPAAQRGAEGSVSRARRGDAESFSAPFTSSPGTPANPSR